MATSPAQERKKRGPSLTFEQNQAVISDLLLHVKTQTDPPELEFGAITKVAKKNRMPVPVVSRIWKEAKKNRMDPNIGAFTRTSNARQSGRKRLYDRQEVANAVAQLPIHKRRTIRKLAKALKVPKSTIQRLVKESECILPHTNTIKPILTDENKLSRFLYACEQIEGLGDDAKFHDFFKDIHIDEKWFFLSEETLRCYLGLGEKAPERWCKHKSHIIKVMFLCAVARPRYDDEGNCIFDGKIGIWPFVKKVVAKRSSKNREAGTEEVKPVKVTKNVYREFMVEKVIPAIKEKWPDRRERKQIRVQHDNAPSHFKKNDPVWLRAAGMHPVDDSSYEDSDAEDIELQVGDESDDGNLDDEDRSFSEDDKDDTDDDDNDNDDDDDDSSDSSSESYDSSDYNSDDDDSDDESDDDDEMEQQNAPEEVPEIPGANHQDWIISIAEQPANSPDTNLLDLTFFRALQSRQWDDGYGTTVDELIAQVEKAYHDFPPEAIDRGFTTLQSCLDEIIQCEGANTYKIPHLQKEARARAGNPLPKKLPVTDAALEVLEVAGFLK